MVVQLFCGAAIDMSPSSSLYDSEGENKHGQGENCVRLQRLRLGLP